MIKITITSVFVADQDAALTFYTDVLGFQKRHDVPIGEFKWLTVTSPADPEGVELLLEPNENPTALAYQQGIKEQGIPAASFTVDDLDAEYKRLTGLGVVFTMPPTPMGPVVGAVLDDTCGNLIMLSQVSA